MGVSAFTCCQQQMLVVIRTSLHLVEASQVLLSILTLKKRWGMRKTLVFVVLVCCWGSLDGELMVLHIWYTGEPFFQSLRPRRNRSISSRPTFRVCWNPLRERDSINMPLQSFLTSLGTQGSQNKRKKHSIEWWCLLFWLAINHLQPFRQFS